MNPIKKRKDELLCHYRNELTFIQSMIFMPCQTDNALTRQYEALLAVDHVHLHFEESALDALAQAAQLENETKEDIGARRLHTLFEKMLEDISFNAGGDMPDVDVTINGEYVAEHLGADAKKMDMRQYIL